MPKPRRLSRRAGIVSEPKHTPGPWTLASCSHGGLILRRGDAIGRDTHIQSSLQVLPEADAHLIAAAPDLLEALKAMLSEYGDVGDESILEEDEPNHPVIVAHRAIAKAEGR